MLACNCVSETTSQLTGHVMRILAAVGLVALLSGMGGFALATGPMGGGGGGSLPSGPPGGGWGGGGFNPGTAGAIGGVVGGILGGMMAQPPQQPQTPGTYYPPGQQAPPGYYPQTGPGAYAPGGYYPQPYNAPTEQTPPGYYPPAQPAAPSSPAETYVDPNTPPAVQGTRNLEPPPVKPGPMYAGVKYTDTWKYKVTQAIRSAGNAALSVGGFFSYPVKVIKTAKDVKTYGPTIIKDYKDRYDSYGNRDVKPPANDGYFKQLRDASQDN